jgi:ribosome biogenesis GTPase
MKGVEQLKEMMIGKVSMFSGHSGVGKSTLVNAMEPSLHLKTKVISEASKQGQHTTTFAEMYDLSLVPKSSIRLVLKVLGRYGAS